MKSHNATITRGLLRDGASSALSKPRIIFPKKDAVPRLLEWFKEGETEGSQPEDPDNWVFGKKFDMELDAWLDDPSKAREFTSEYWNSPARRKELDKETSEADRDRVIALRALRHAFTADEDKARDILNRVQEKLSFPEKLAVDLPFSANRNRIRLLYPLIFSDALKNSRVRMWPTQDGEYVPVIWCEDMTAAMFAHAAFNGVEACQNCGKLFCPDLPRVDGSRAEKFCTVACGQRLRQRVYRKRRKEGKGKSQ
jgi:hypothetical protein